MRSPRLAIAVILALIALGPLAGLIAAPPAQAVGVLPPSNPSTDRPLDAAASSACEMPGANTSATCESEALTQIDHARAAEGVGPMALPSDFGSLGAPEQLAVVFSLERSARDLSVPLGLVAAYNADAQAGADRAADPAAPPGYATFGAVEAQGLYSVLITDYEWMYDDGFGSANADCTSPSAPGCWIHRDVILGDYSATPNFYMGAAQSTSAGPVYAAILVASTQAQPVVYSYDLIALTRLGGANRDLTSVAVSQNRFAAGQSAGAVVLATDAAPPDALAGAPLAVAKDAPLLLTPPASLDPAVATEIVRVLAKGGTVYILGGSAAVSPGVTGQVQALGYTVAREAGSDRFGTALAIAGALGAPTTVFVADGTGFADALIAGPAAARDRGAILLSNGDSMPAATASYLSTHQGLRYAIGAGARAADPQALGLGGRDGYATSVAVAQSFFVSTRIAGFASEASYADELSGDSHIAALGGPIILAPASGALPSSVSSYLTGSAISSGWIYGGTSAVSPSVQQEIAAG